MPVRKGITKQLRAALDNVRADIAIKASGGKIAAGLASEGYAGGYQQALWDVDAALRGVPPSNSRYWPKQEVAE